ncbi:coiled-coil domain-containing protein [Candidatus Cytomitobacter primus]|uniref:Uncharacterized protein n=1 Tax=Candidatus Cytomitobacter primus TaxID=2066024 RepID=A0A5C0UE35_9PROT|nr:hypothetical protein [Candidatus Cytomitobacter primus]QEK38346.1 hypothetical protein FZC34_00180 [Candidatus Cytomitobacter primus]|eukprot:TRINITY_DN12299_c0_g1_i1.p1 TRINITY_DN12299_c0_g1~~TRINITY_DN12299_c0_g1_i1.p1  ORF type:complete len:742 (+),score=-53.58 TRINITY_DN12299_c0_g1_i1:62-2287(+)
MKNIFLLYLVFAQVYAGSVGDLDEMSAGVCSSINREMLSHDESSNASRGYFAVHSVSTTPGFSPMSSFCSTPRSSCTQFYPFSDLSLDHLSDVDDTFDSAIHYFIEYTKHMIGSIVKAESRELIKILTLKSYEESDKIMQKIRNKENYCFEGFVSIKESLLAKHYKLHRMQSAESMVRNKYGDIEGLARTELVDRIAIMNEMNQYMDRISLQHDLLQGYSEIDYERKMDIIGGAIYSEYGSCRLSSTSSNAGENGISDENDSLSCDDSNPLSLNYVLHEDEVRRFIYKDQGEAWNSLVMNMDNSYRIKYESITNKLIMQLVKETQASRDIIKAQQAIIDMQQGKIEEITPRMQGNLYKGMRDELILLVRDGDPLPIKLTHMGKTYDGPEIEESVFYIETSGKAHERVELCKSSVNISDDYVRYDIAIDIYGNLTVKAHTVSIPNVAECGSNSIFNAQSIMDIREISQKKLQSKKVEMIDQEINEIQNSIKFNESEVQKYNQRSIEGAKEIEEIKTQIEKNNAEIAEIQENIKELQDDINEKNKQAKEMIDKNRDSDVEIKKITNQIERCKKSISRFDTEIKEHNAKIQENKKSAKEDEKKAKIYEETAKYHESLIKECKEKSEKCSAEIKEFEINIKDAVSANKERGEKIDELKEEVQEVQESINEENESVEKKESKIRELNKRIESKLNLDLWKKNESEYVAKVKQGNEKLAELESKKEEEVRKLQEINSQFNDFFLQEQ